jgi:hypothetical protein
MNSLAVSVASLQSGGEARHGQVRPATLDDIAAERLPEA